jgi:hypothetical protein
MIPVHDWSTRAAADFGKELQEQQALYAALLACSRRQLEALRNEPHTVALEALLPEKQGWMERISALEERLQARKREWPSVRSGLPASACKGVDDALERLQETLKELIQVEESGAELVTTKLTDRRQALTRLAGGKQIAQAYHTGKATSSRFIDNRQ